MHTINELHCSLIQPYILENKYQLQILSFAIAAWCSVIINLYIYISAGTKANSTEDSG